MVSVLMSAEFGIRIVSALTVEQITLLLLDSFNNCVLSHVDADSNEIVDDFAIGITSGCGVFTDGNAVFGFNPEIDDHFASIYIPYNAQNELIVMRNINMLRMLEDAMVEMVEEKEATTK